MNINKLFKIGLSNHKPTKELKLKQKKELIFLKQKEAVARLVAYEKTLCPQCGESMLGTAEVVCSRGHCITTGLKSWHVYTGEHYTGGGLQ